MITADSTLREIAAAAFEAGFSVTVTPMPTPTRADRITAESGPRDVCWRWMGPWRRFRHIQPTMSGAEKVYEGWERMYLVAAWDVDTGEALWDRKYGTVCFTALYDDPPPSWGAVEIS